MRVKRQTNLLPSLVITLLALMVSLSGLVYYFFIPNQNIVPAYDSEKLTLIIDGNVINTENDPVVQDGEVLLSFSVAKEHLDKNLFWDEDLQKLTVTTRDKLVRMNTDNLTAYVNNKPVTLKVSVRLIDGVVYVPITFLSNFYPIRVTWNESAGTVVIDRESVRPPRAFAVVPEAAVRKGPSIKSPIIKKVDVPAVITGRTEGENVIINIDDEKLKEALKSEPSLELKIYGEVNGWYKVRTSEGYIGYIEKKNVGLLEPEIWGKPASEPPSPWKPEDGKINLVWEGIWHDEGIDTAKIPAMEGLNVISPTWFTVASEDGTIVSRAEFPFMEWARKNNYKVWALFANDFSSPQLTHKVLSDGNARENMIRQLLVFAELYQLDGINVDFENINIEDRDYLTQFMRELTPLLKEQGLTVTMDVHIVPDGSNNYSRCYDRKALSEVVDYFMLMGYDQHTRGGGISGSVAQITWVEKNLKKSLELIPAEKIILGIPFYTREWKETIDENGKKEVIGTTLSMDKARSIIEEYKLDPVWDEESGQFYVEYTEDGARYRIWIEDTHSIDLKASLVGKYGLAGTAAWMRGYEIPEIWEVLSYRLDEDTAREVFAEVGEEDKKPFGPVHRPVKD